MNDLREAAAALLRRSRTPTLTDRAIAQRVAMLFVVEPAANDRAKPSDRDRHRVRSRRRL
jgi:hypothetical protein